MNEKFEQIIDIGNIVTNIVTSNILIADHFMPIYFCDKMKLSDNLVLQKKTSFPKLVEIRLGDKFNEATN